MRSQMSSKIAAAVQNRWTKLRLAAGDPTSIGPSKRLNRLFTSGAPGAL